MKRFIYTWRKSDGAWQRIVGHAAAFNDLHEREDRRSRMMPTCSMFKLADLEGTDGINH